MSRSFDAVVLGAGPDGLVAATVLARRGRRVLLLEEAAEPGGTLREIEFAPGFRAAPLAPDAGYVSPEVLRAIGVTLPRAVSTDPTVAVLGGGRPLALYRDPARMAEALRPHGAADALAWPGFCARVAALAGFLGELCRRAAPRVAGATLREHLALGQLALRYRRLGRAGMVDLLRALPMPLADLLDDWFESEPLKGALAGLGVLDLPRGPLAGGTALNFLYRQIGAAPGVFGERLRLPGGPSALADSLVGAARAAGVVIEADVAIERLVVNEERIAGVRTGAGEEIASRIVISSLDPYRSLLELLGPEYLDTEFIDAVRRVRFRGASSRLLLALDDLPPLPEVAGSPAGAWLIAPSIRYVERAADAAKYGRCAAEPLLVLRVPSLWQPELAPPGRQVAVLHIQNTPYALRAGDWSQARDAVADTALAAVERHLPGFTARVRERLLLAPPDLETRFGLREGALSQGEMMLDQLLFMRPVPGCARYATPVPGLFLCGAGTHPGYGLAGQSGLLATKKGTVPS